MGLRGQLRLCRYLKVRKYDFSGLFYFKSLMLVIREVNGGQKHASAKETCEKGGKQGKRNVHCQRLQASCVLCVA